MNLTPNPSGLSNALFEISDKIKKSCLAAGAAKIINLPSMMALQVSTLSVCLQVIVSHKDDPMNVERYIKRQVLVKTHVFLVKTAPGFREEAANMFSNHVKWISTTLFSDLFQKNWMLKNHQRGFTVEGFTPKEMGLIALTFPYAEDILMEVGTYRYGFQSDFAHIDFDKMAALSFGAESVQIQFKDYQGLSGFVKEKFLDKLQNHTKKLIDSVETNTLFFERLKECSNRLARFECYLDENRHRVFVSLSGDGLCKRRTEAGGGEGLSGKAPVREDICALLIAKAFLFSGFGGAFRAVVPFAGSGGFVSELYQLMPCLSFGKGFDRGVFVHPLYNTFYVLCGVMGLANTMGHAARKLKESREVTTPAEPLSILLIDPDPKALASSEKRLGRLPSVQIKVRREMFCRDHLSTEDQGFPLFLPMNPPWGIRLGTKKDSRKIYSEIGKILGESEEASVFGFVLCGDEDQSRLLLRELTSSSYRTEVFHYTQGGVHVRTVFFASMSLGP